MALNFKDLPPEKQEYMPDIRRRVATLAWAKVIDLRELESKRTRIKGSGYCLSDAERRNHGAGHTCSSLNLTTPWMPRLWRSTRPRGYESATCQLRPPPDTAQCCNS